MCRRPVTIAFVSGRRSNPYSFSTCRARSNDFQFTSEPDSSRTKILAASCWKYPTLCLARKRLGCSARTLIREVDGAVGAGIRSGSRARPNQIHLFRRAERRLPRRRSAADDETLSFLSSRTLWNSGRDEYSPGGTQSKWLENCCRTFCATTPNAPELPSRTTDAKLRRRRF